MPFRRRQHTAMAGAALTATFLALAGCSSPAPASDATAGGSAAGARHKRGMKAEQASQAQGENWQPKHG